MRPPSDIYITNKKLQAELDELNEKQQESHHLAKQLNKLLMYLDELKNAPRTNLSGQIFSSKRSTGASFIKIMMSP
ncbi:hypothetical protein KHA80_12480 [Anaerobacillus sp. HL2]|nr:hypothetical protein KHA80_12480 [Anaerobacillus sp. HL2]